MRFVAAARSHVGLRRPNNEDSGFASPTCLVVADGVGGSPAGEIASATATYAIATHGLTRVGLRPKSVLAKAIEFAGQQLNEGVRLNPSRDGMAATLTAVLTDGSRCALAHLGDSRAYVLREGRLLALTEDHTWAAAIAELEGDLAQHPWRNVLARSLKSGGEDVGDIRGLRLLVGDRVLVCSDGLTDLVTESDLATQLVEGAPAVVAERLIAAALAAGGRDNVTVVVADVTDLIAETELGPVEVVGAASDRLNVIEAAGLPWPPAGPAD